MVIAKREVVRAVKVRRMMSSPPEFGELLLVGWNVGEGAQERDELTCPGVSTPAGLHLRNFWQDGFTLPIFPSRTPLLAIRRSLGSGNRWHDSARRG